MMPEWGELPQRDPGIPRFVALSGVAVLLLATWILFRPTTVEDAIIKLDDSTQQTSSDDLEALGAGLFVAQGCGSCHSADGPDSQLGPSMAGLAQRAELRIQSSDYLGQATSASAYVAEALLDHCLDPLAGYDCPARELLSLRLSETDGEAIAAFLLRQDQEVQKP